ncbi:sugar kinase [Rhodococcus sp. BP-252]|uniref:sugar kinase n=1 Tax=unclassified Rhodococcus (in: high G+C Gram-positive bacteria) TaxID=192944 RepID=UPI001C9B2714|nr:MULTISPECIES: sugar kinase [unclassified Rhodococcus (in: high G+C Gram-positive bacteria)]MBY6414326.1 sugar kinase [Rhodococcus sp. BP-320]MBY6419096.1 sugar kinase [Rhodococcus sp. BP-321]MBY6423813.1 sugar kinase [Rhodococcus sp. BP-324]MBY6429197.1 sugar kinase [Rhodococcus sp. BP-323]MBY6434136.1 sugar kinase [Rhodococcus sp. BP-322]
MPDILCIGETMTLVTPVDAAPLASADLFGLHMGGAESTVALYLVEQGHSVAWVSQVGNDPLGQRIVDEIASHGVDTSFVTMLDDAPTGVYFKDPDDGITTVHYYRRDSAASRMSPATLDRLPLREVSIVHVSGINAGLSNSCAAMMDSLFDLCAGSPTSISFDVNYRPGVWGVDEASPVLLELARRADIVFVGRDEAAELWGTTDAESVATLIRSPERAATLVVKDSDVGATEFTESGAVFVPAHAVEVVEVVGAGDAFAAGYLSGLVNGKAAYGRLSMGHDLAARALSSTSDFVPAEGLDA